MCIAGSSQLHGKVNIIGGKQSVEDVEQENQDKKAKLFNKNLVAVRGEGI